MLGNVNVDTEILEIERVDTTVLFGEIKFKMPGDVVFMRALFPPSRRLMRYTASWSAQVVKLI